MRVEFRWEILQGVKTDKKSWDYNYMTFMRVDFRWQILQGVRTDKKFWDYNYMTLRTDMRVFKE